MDTFAEVAISGPLRKTFTYAVSASDAPLLQPGLTVSVEFGKRRVRGFYLGPAPKPSFPTKPLTVPRNAALACEPERLEFYRWLADYYFANPADTLALALPPHTRRAVNPRLYLNEPLTSAAQSALSLIPERIARRLDAGKPLRKPDLKEIDSVTVGGVRALLDSGALVERHEAVAAPPGRLRGYRIAQPELVAQEVDAESLPLVGSIAPVSRARLLDAGMSDYRIKLLCEAGALVKVYANLVDDLLDTLPARRDVGGLRLNVEQRAACEHISPSLGAEFKAFLLHGVTGSGKSLVYSQLARETLRRGKSTLALTPEIALAGELLAYLRGTLGADVALWHSALSVAERAALWRRLTAGDARVLVGARSALFAPLKHLGLIIVDEEHDESYKQDEPAPRFHGRDAAVMLARTLKIPIVLGSGTPSLESYYNAQRGRYSLVELRTRPGGTQQPRIELIDMNSERLSAESPHVSCALKEAVTQRLANKQQVILYLNRRGFAPRLRCRECGETPSCPDCNSALTYHKRGERLICHFCGFTRADITRCPACGGAKLSQLGAGTQKLEDSAAALFAGARAVRLDTDAVTRGGAWKTLRDFADGKYNLLLGTQMISKGIDIPGVSLVGAVMADAEANLVDFRAGEKSFAKLTQVAGRSGRAGTQGLALTQTYNPRSALMQAVAAGDYHAFYESELADRRRAGFPPFSRIARIVLSATQEAPLENAAAGFAAELRARLGKARSSARTLGPAPCQMYRLRGRYRRHVLVTVNGMKAFVDLLTDWDNRSPRFGLPTTVRVAVDIDANDFL
ncbi:MAG TPA: primosomal protein N' [candidate division Zixibacteria bacterium]|nr:primosomal protein N' [candidate division Zixibacteria bacterium]